MVDSRVFPGLERKPGIQNWVDRAHGLPDYIERIAKHLHYEKGMTISRAIATAVNTVKRWARMGKVAKYGDPHNKHVSAKTAALAAKAVAEWEAKKAAGKIHLSEDLLRLIDLTEISEDYAIYLAEGILDEDGDIIDLAVSDASISSSDTMVALMIPPKVASKVAQDGGVSPQDLHLTLTFHGATTPEQYNQICQDLAAWAAEGGPGELNGHVGGLGQFPPGPDGVPHYAPADVPGINALHEQVKAVTAKSAPASEDHGFTPHMTLGYTKDGQAPPSPVPKTPVSFSSMHVVRGNKQRTEIPLGDTRTSRRGGARRSRRGTLRTGVNLTEGHMDITDLAERANRISDPARRAAARAKVLDLAVNPTAEQRRKYGDKNGRFPVWNRESLRSAILLAHKPADRRHVILAARRLGLSSMIPDTWSTNLAELAMQGILDLASTIAPLHPSGRVSDGRRSYKKQGKWKHGFIPVDTPAAESKAKGSPIAMRRLNRLFGSAAKGRAGQRSVPGAGDVVKHDPKTVAVDEKNFPGSESAKSLAALRNSPFGEEQNANRVKGGYKRTLPKSQKEASIAGRVPERARQDWDQIPANLKTVRNGKRYVLAEFGGKGFITPWVGGVQQVTGTSLDKRQVYATLAPNDAMQMEPAQLRDIVNNPKSPSKVKTVARKALRDLAARKKAASNG